MLPAARREQIRGELQQLSKATPASRRKQMRSPNFRAKYTLSEQQVMDKLLNTASNQ
jgi:hypothetical protein